MSAAMNVLVTLATERTVSSVIGRGGANSASPALPSQVCPSARRTATWRPATRFLPVVRRRMASILRMVAASSVGPSAAGEEVGDGMGDAGAGDGDGAGGGDGVGEDDADGEGRAAIEGAGAVDAIDAGAADVVTDTHPAVNAAQRNRQRNMGPASDRMRPCHGITRTGRYTRRAAFPAEGGLRSDGIATTSLGRTVDRHVRASLHSGDDDQPCHRTGERPRSSPRPSGRRRRAAATRQAAGATAARPRTSRPAGMQRTLEHVQQELHARYPQADLAPVSEAYEFAREAHEGQKRASGEPYVSHPLAVARILAELGLDPGRGHRRRCCTTSPRTPSTRIADIEKRFGADVGAPRRRRHQARPSSAP